MLAQTETSSMSSVHCTWPPRNIHDGRIGTLPLRPNEQVVRMRLRTQFQNYVAVHIMLLSDHIVSNVPRGPVHDLEVLCGFLLSISNPLPEGHGATHVESQRNLFDVRSVRGRSSTVNDFSGYNKHVKTTLGVYWGTLHKGTTSMGSSGFGAPIPPPHIQLCVCPKGRAT